MTDPDALAAAYAALGATPGPAVARTVADLRDRVRGWRTGRWDRVMGGEFDVMD